MNIFKRILNRLIYINLKNKSASFGKNSFVHKNTIITDFKCLYIGENVNIYQNVFVANNKGRLVFKDNSHIAPFGYINCIESTIEIGNNTAIGPSVSIVAYSNYYKEKDTEIDVHVHTKGDIIIGNNVFIGANVSILPGASITDNCVIGAGSVVNKSIKVPGVYAGVPIRLIKKFEF